MTALSLTSTVQIQSVSYNRTADDFLYMASLKAPLFKKESRSPLDLVCVVDRSGSMGGTKIELTKNTLLFVLTQLTSTDRLSVVSFDDIIEVLLPLTNMDESGKNTAERAIASLSARGGTNLCDGLIRGIEVIRNRKTKNEVASVLLFTDGLASDGYTQLHDIKRAMTDPEYAKRSNSTMPQMYSNFSPNMIQQMPMQQMQMPIQQNPMSPTNYNISPTMIQQMPMQQMQMPIQQNPMPPTNYNISPTMIQQMPMQQMQMPIQQNPMPVSSQASLPETHVPLGCTVNTFGFGSDHDPNLLKGIAEHGSGIYYYIQGTDNIPQAFADCLGGLLSVCGQNITMKFEAQNDVNIKKIITKFKTNTITPGKAVELSIGDIQSDEQKDILVSVSLPICSYPVDNFVIGKVSLTYFNVIDCKLENAEVSVVVNRPDGVPSSLTANFELNKQHNRLMAAEAMEKATDAGNSGNLELARQLLRTAISRIKDSISAADPFCQGLIADMVKSEESLRDTRTYQQVGQQMLNNNTNAHYMQRSSNSAMPSQMAYQTPSRMMQQQNFSAVQKK